MSSFMCEELGVDRDLWCRIWGSYLAENEYSLGITLDSIPGEAISTGVRERRHMAQSWHLRPNIERLESRKWKDQTGDLGDSSGLGVPRTEGS